MKIKIKSEISNHEEHLKKTLEEARQMIADRRRYNQTQREVRKTGNGFLDFETVKKQFRFTRVR